MSSSTIFRSGLKQGDGTYFTLDQREKATSSMKAFYMRPQMNMLFTSVAMWRKLRYNFEETNSIRHINFQYSEI
ncbi:unnamed protein product [Sympodiomycopsis kandeliae]